MYKYAVILFLGVISLVSAQQCNSPNATNCNSCLKITGCNFCQHYNGYNCTSATTKETADCTTKSGDYTDVFITNINNCVKDECPALETCNDCSKSDGCTWCFVGNSIGCIPTNTVATTCTAPAVGTACAVPCPAIPDCSSCIEAGCNFCQTDKESPSGGTCHKATDTCPSGSTKQTGKEACPVGKPGNSGATLIASFGVIAASLLF